MEPAINPIHRALDRDDHRRDASAETWASMIKNGAGRWVATDINVAETLQSSPFFRLPLEIRMIIYALIIGQRDLLVHKPNGPCSPGFKWPNRQPLGFQSKTRSGAAKAAQDLQNLRTTKSPLAIAFTCRQIYHEAVKVWYGSVRFYFFGLPCMAVFLTEIGTSNRNTIRHVGYDHNWGFFNSQTTEVMQLACTHLVGLRDLALNCGYKPLHFYCGNSIYRQHMRNQWDICEAEARELLSLGDRLEVVAMSRIVVNSISQTAPFQRIGTVESLQLKRDKGTGSIVTESSTVEYDDTCDGRNLVKLCGGGGVYIPYS